MVASLLGANHSFTNQWFATKSEATYFFARYYKLWIGDEELHEE